MPFYEATEAVNMGYTYEQRKRPQGQQNSEPERTTAPVPGHNVLIPGTAAPQSVPSFDLGGAMQARMANTFWSTRR